MDVGRLQVLRCSSRRQQCSNPDASYKPSWHCRRSTGCIDVGHLCVMQWRRSARGWASHNVSHCLVLLERVMPLHKSVPTNHPNIYPMSGKTHRSDWLVCWLADSSLVFHEYFSNGHLPYSSPSVAVQCSAFSTRRVGPRLDSDVGCKTQLHMGRDIDILTTPHLSCLLTAVLLWRRRHRLTCPASVFVLSLVWLSHAVSCNSKRVRATEQHYRVMQW